MTDRRDLKMFALSPALLRSAAAHDQFVTGEP